MCVCLYIIIFCSCLVKYYFDTSALLSQPIPIELSLYLASVMQALSLWRHCCALSSCQGLQVHPFAKCGTAHLELTDIECEIMSCISCIHCCCGSCEVRCVYLFGCMNMCVCVCRMLQVADFVIPYKMRLK